MWMVLLVWEWFGGLFYAESSCLPWTYHLLFCPSKPEPGLLRGSAWGTCHSWNQSFCLFVWSLSHAQLFVTPWTAARQAPLSMGLPRQEYWSGLPFLSLGDLPDPGIEPTSPALAGGFFTREPAGKPWNHPFNNICSTGPELGLSPSRWFQCR